MNMRLYGICFKLRGGPALLDHVQADSPVPVDMMRQVVEQMDGITPEEMAYAERLDTDWKRAFNERVPLSMSVNENGGFNIECSVPDELLDAVSLLTGLEPGKLMEEYTADHLRTVCGIDTEIVRVDVDHVDDVPAAVHAAGPAVQAPQGFSFDDLDEEPAGPDFDDVSAFSGMDMAAGAPDMEPAFGTGMGQAVADAAGAADAVPDAVLEGIPLEGPDEGIPMDGPDGYGDMGYDDDGMPMDGPEDGGYEDSGFPEEDMPDEGYGEGASEEEPEAEPEAEPEPDPDALMKEALSDIYKDLVGNIKDRKLDERLGLKIG